MVGIKTDDLFDKTASIYVLSCLMHDPLLLQDERYVLSVTDFDYSGLHQLVYSTIYNLAAMGSQILTAKEIDTAIKTYGAQYNYYEREKGYEFVVQCYAAVEDNEHKQFAAQYDRVKKFSLLRDLKRMGLDIKRFYDSSDILNRDIQDDRLNKISLNEILNSVRSELVTIENKHIGKSDSSSQNAIKGLRQLVTDLELEPEVGLPIEGSIINYAGRGARLGKLYTYSAPSGAGKTRYMLGNACAISMPYINKDGKVVIRGSVGAEDYKKVLFVTTEQQADEIQTMLLAYVSGVNEKKILLGNYNDEERKRIAQALDIIDAYGENFLIECIPDPSIEMVKARLIKYIVQDEVQYIFYDYIFSSPGLLSEFRDISVREDVALMMLSNSLKEIAMIYNVFIQSATQLNDGWTKREIGLRDQNCIRGSKAIADKIDMGLIGVRLQEEEKKQIDALWQELRRSNPVKYQMEPNIVVDIYKNRRGELNCVKIFRYFDFSTCHAHDLFITDPSYKTVSEADIGEIEFELNKYDFLELKLKNMEEK